MSGHIRAALSEPRRRLYLQALGLELLRARMPLPGAAPSAEAYDEQPVPVAKPEPARAALRAMPTSAAASSASASSASATPATVTTPSPPPSPEIATRTARFSLQLVAISASHSALIDLDNQPALEGAEAQLWRVICSAFAWQAQSAEYPAQFHWPIPGLPATLAAGQDALAGWLQTQQPEPRAVLVFADGLGDFVPGAQYVLPSLRQLLAAPLRKRELMLTLAALLP